MNLKPANFLSLSFTHLVLLLLALYLSTDSLEWFYGASTVPDIRNIFVLIGTVFLSMHLIGYYFRMHGSDTFKSKYAKIFILVACSTLYADYAYRFVNRSIFHWNRGSASRKISTAKHGGSHGSQLTLAEYQAIAATVHSNQEQSHEITRFPELEPLAIDIEYWDYNYPVGDWKTQYYFEVSYNLPTEMKETPPNRIRLSYGEPDQVKF